MVQVRPSMDTPSHPPSHASPPSRKLAEMLKNATPAQRQAAVKMAAALLNKRAEREAKGGTVDLTEKA
jgi:hypothetical protein